MLKWVPADPDSDMQDTFELEANGAALSSLDYMVPNFKLVDEDPAFFDAIVFINFDQENEDENEPAISGSFEWRAGTLSHEIAAGIQDDTVENFVYTNITHSSVVTSESLIVISKLKKPDTGFEGVFLGFAKLD